MLMRCCDKISIAERIVVFKVHDSYQKVLHNVVYIHYVFCVCVRQHARGY